MSHTAASARFSSDQILPVASILSLFSDFERPYGGAGYFMPLLSRLRRLAQMNVVGGSGFPRRTIGRRVGKKAVAPYPVQQPPQIFKTSRISTIHLEGTFPQPLLFDYTSI